MNLSVASEYTYIAKSMSRKILYLITKGLYFPMMHIYAGTYAIHVIAVLGITPTPFFSIGHHEVWQRVKTMGINYIHMHTRGEGLCFIVFML